MRSIARLRLPSAICWIIATMASLAGLGLSAQNSPFWMEDPTFKAARTVEIFRRQLDGKLLVRGQPGSQIARLNVDGSLDSTFSATVDSNDYIAQFAVQPSGKIVALGEFDSNTRALGEVRLARFNADGSRDRTFSHPTKFAPLAVDAQGYIYGYVDEFTNELKRLTPDGALDPSFVCRETYVNKAGPQADGSILITVYTGPSQERLKRLRHDGSIDPAFQLDTSIYAGPYDQICEMVPLADGRTILILQITLQVPGSPSFMRLGRMSTTGSIDYVFSSNFVGGGYPPDRFSIANAMLDLLRASGENSCHVDLTNTQERAYFVVLANGQLLTPDNTFIFGELKRYNWSNSTGANQAPFLLGSIVPDERTVNVGATVDMSVLVGGLSPFTYEWNRDGTILPEAKGSSLHLVDIQPSEAGVYRVTIRNAHGSTVSNPVRITVLGEPTGGPNFILQPLSATSAVDGSVTFQAVATSPRPVSYQWYHEGEPIAGATASTFTLNRVRFEDGGIYTVKAFTSVNSRMSEPATLTLLGTSRISNLSVRTNLGAGKTLTVGFVTSRAKSVLVRAVGPSLKTIFGAEGVFTDPRLVLNGPSGAVLDQNENWTPDLSAAFTALGAFPLAPSSADAALIKTIDGPATASINGVGAGLLLVEVYDAGSPASPVRLKNASARNQVGTGADILVSGFVIDGTAAKKLLVRGIGPALADTFGVSGVIVDPKLEIHQTVNGQDTIVAANDNWDASLASTFAAVGAYAFKVGSRDAALVITLPPGAYTAQVSGVNGVTGDGVVEVYEVP